MKKLLLLLVVAPLLCRPLAAEEAADAEPPSREFPFVLFDRWRPKWTVFQFSACPVSLFPAETDVYGLNAALTLGNIQNRVVGVSFAGFFAMVLNSHCGVMLSGLYSVLGDNYGVSIAPINFVDRNFGIMLGLANTAPVNPDGTTGFGIQIGLFNHAGSGLQIGLHNYNGNALLKWLPLLNFSLPAKEAESAPDAP